MRCISCGCENPNYAVVCEQCGEFLPKEDLTVTKKQEIIPKQPEIANESASEQSEIKDESISDAPVSKGMIRCRNCWTDNPSGTTHCIGCGKEFRSAATRAKADAAFDTLVKQKDERLRCVNCGNMNTWDALTCEKCGNPPRERIPSPGMDEDELLLSVQLIKAAIKARKAAKDKKQKEAERAAWSRSRSEINYAVPGKVRCRSCWFDNPPGEDFCQSCGRRLPRIKHN